MKIVLKTLMAGPGGCFLPGQVIEVDEAEGKRLIAAGVAIPLETIIEITTIEPPERAVLPRGKPRKVAKR